MRVLLVDDSPFVCKLMAEWLTSSGDIDVVAAAHDGYQGMGMIEWLKPDVVTLDLEMPSINGLETLQHIMAEHPTPVVVVSGVSREAATAVENALALGAVDFFFKYQPGSEASPEAFRKEICEKIKAAAQSPVTRHNGNGVTKDRTQLHRRSVPSDPANPTRQADQVLVIGVSTGGVDALQRVLEQLPSDYPAGVLVVPHIPATFTSAVVGQMSERLTMPVREARNGDLITPGAVLVAPGDMHMLVGPDMRIILDGSPPVRGYRPSIDVTMQAVAGVFRRMAMGAVLTGTGEDGTAGLAAIQANGGKTFAQDPESCVAPAMPQRVIEKGFADHVGSPEALGMQLKVLTP